MTNQQTIKQEISLEGVGIHSGQPAKVIIRPAPENKGIVFFKKDIEIPAVLASLSSTNRSTSLAGLSLVEHFLSAAAGLGIDNLSVEIIGNELPILDGSAAPYAYALKNAGIIRQLADKNFLRLPLPVRLEAGEAFLEAVPYNGFAVDFMVNFKGVGEQSFFFDDLKQDYLAEIAPARTFGYLHEHEALKKKGLGLGASLENALVIGEKGFVNQPRFPEELARHKILDLIGDLALAGRPIKAKIRAVRSGHKLNIELLRRVLING
ncbi:MAG: UDP-3-O-acyl-N-acetylglucosamine deacetylase [bacterium]